MDKLNADALVFAFANGSVGGNPSYVVATEPGQDCVAAACTALAVARGCEVTHVVFDVQAGAASVRFYSPAGPIAFCGHGSLAAAAWAAASGRASEQLTLHYGAGSIDMHMRDAGREVGYLERAGQVAALSIDGPRLEQLRAALGLPDLRPDQVKLSAGGAQRLKALIELADADLLGAIAVSSAAADLLCEQLGVTGLYPYCVAGEALVRARHFPMQCGAVEDMATGNIAPTVAQHVTAGASRPLLIEQGGRDCKVSRLMLVPDGPAWQVNGMCRMERQAAAPAV